LDEAVEIVFTGHDRGIDDGVEHYYERSLPVEEALREEMLLAYGMNSQPLPPQHGAPLRLIVPDWYGMASVKWLKGITVLNEPFDGIQQTAKYQYKSSKEDPGTPITHKTPHALMIPPGLPDYLSRTRHLKPGRVSIQGRAWSGRSPVERVEFSSDGGLTWEDASLGEQAGNTGGPVGPTSGRRGNRASTSYASGLPMPPGTRNHLPPRSPGTTADIRTTPSSAYTL
jgi:DMSO/TMAO reductase YedYZ molybdopterin-dependent catalytic subunit